VINPQLDTFDREVTQNSHDQRLSGQKASVRFTLSSLDGEAKEAFLDALAWPNLSDHLKGAAESGGITIGPQLRQALDDLEDGPLALLRIDDWGTKGLYGGEDAATGNFAALCRHTLVTSETARERGGSFGLGKSVLWRFSRFSTVLFSSRFQDGDESRLRFIGRCELPFHQTSEQSWAGAGWYGTPQRVEGGERAESVWGGSAEEASLRLQLLRPVEMGTGTSILILGFFEPRIEDQRGLEEIARDLIHSSARWFWPSMDPANESLTVSVRYTDEHGDERELAADITSEVLPFVHAKNAATVVPVVKVPGDVAERVIPFTIPAKTEFAGGGPEQIAEMLIRLRLATPDQSGDLGATVALMRGAGFVVKYQTPGELLTEVPFHAVLLSGLARGSEDSDKALDAFLRAAEPVSHNAWEAGTDRLGAEYRQGATARLRELWKAIARAAAEMCEVDQPDESQGPAKLRELFALRGRGGGAPTESGFRVDDQWAWFRGGRWNFRAAVTRTARSERRWGFSATLHLEGESGLGDQLPIESIATDVGTCTIADGVATCVVSPGTREVKILDGQSAQEIGFDLSRTAVRFTVRPKAIG
jgi:hypothetical protein